ncbi:MAG: hypothetical protein AAB602_01950 [Patescibacteria group bacterium]
MASSEARICQNCKSEFFIELEDFDFYKKISVPPPTWCPECRNQRRMSWREERSLYRGVCKLCGKSIITIHAPGGPFTVYCRECYNSDAWDSMDYGREYDFGKPFFKQYRELMEAVPRPALTGSNLVNSDFTQACESVKNCYYTFWSYFSENSSNCYALLLSRNAYDCYVADNSDHIHECLHSNRLYKTRFGYFSDDCFDSSFLFDCVGCSDCFGCVNLRKQKYCLFNKKLSKDEYKEQIKYWDIGSYKKLLEAKKKFRALYLSLPHRYAHVVSSRNVTGDIIRDAKDCLHCFSALDGVQNCKYVYFGGLNLKDSYDVSGGGVTSELLYEVFGVTGHAQRCFFSVGGGNSRDIWYSDWINNSSDMFGCISIKNKKYCILNKQYTREEYGEFIQKIKKHMDAIPYVDKKGRIYKFGEFFPTELSAYAYNETFGFPWYPKTKQDVLDEGWQWRDPVERSYKITMQSENIPDHIRDAKDAMCEEIISCPHGGKCNEQCATAFRISKEELGFYREMNIALPRFCPSCRNAERLRWRNSFRLWRRNCMCPGSDGKQETGDKGAVYQNTATHFHGNSNCVNQFETTFSPEKPEIIYCDQCYRAEFI